VCLFLSFIRNLERIYDMWRGTWVLDELSRKLVKEWDNVDSLLFKGSTGWLHVVLFWSVSKNVYKKGS
jgi:hypothetical protein